MTERVPVLLRLKPDIKHKLDIIKGMNSKILRVDLSMNGQLERLIEDEFNRLVNTGNQ